VELASGEVLLEEEVGTGVGIAEDSDTLDVVETVDGLMEVVVGTSEVVKKEDASSTEVAVDMGDIIGRDVDKMGNETTVLREVEIHGCVFKLSLVPDPLSILQPLSPQQPFTVIMRMPPEARSQSSTLRIISAIHRFFTKK
jgi:hypothetical protein